MSYPSTRWSQVVEATGDSPAARAALAWLCERYWDCLQAHARRRGLRSEDAEDLTQDFLLALIRGEILPRADPARGRFRTFLLACLDHHLLRARERRQALKRGGGAAQVSLEAELVAAPPEATAFDRDWAEQVVRRARESVQAQEEPLRWQVLSPFLTANGDAAGYQAAGERLGLREGAVKVAVHRLRDAYRTAVRQEVAQTLQEPDEALIDAELAQLLRALGTPP